MSAPVVATCRARDHVGLKLAFVASILHYCSIKFASASDTGQWIKREKSQSLVIINAYVVASTEPSDY